MGFKQKYTITPRYLPKGTKRRSGILMPRVGFFVAHDTGNKDSTAEGNVGYYTRSANEMSASAHVFLDDKEILECVPLFTGKPEKAWHNLYDNPEDNAMFGDDANDIAGGIELCYGDNINPVEAYKRYIWTLAYGAYKFNLNVNRFIAGHFLLDPRRKTDPVNALKTMGKTYSQLLKDVVAEYNACTAPEVAKIELDNHCHIEINGKAMPFIGWVMDDGKSYLPIRLVAEQFGAGGKVGWDNTKGKATINGKILPTTFVDHGTGYAWTWEIVNALGGIDVKWDAAAFEVELRKKG